MSVSTAEAPKTSNYGLGVAYSVCTAFLLAAQNPFSAAAAKRLSTPQFVCVSEFALLAAIPLMLLSPGARRDFRSLVVRANIGKWLILFAIGLAGLVLYNFGLSGAHPIIIAAILNLSPFWAALVALLLTKKSIPISPLMFFAYLGVAFAGAMVVAASQTPATGDSSLKSLGKALVHGTWIFAVPVPIFYSLSGTLVREWFAEFEEAASVALMFLVSAVLLIPGASYLMYLRSESLAQADAVPAMALLLIGTLIASAAGRVVYQLALSATANDNGFVSMFLLLVPPITCLLSIPMSWWIPDLKFVAGPTFFIGLALIAAPLLAFSLQSMRSGATGEKAR